MVGAGCRVLAGKACVAYGNVVGIQHWAKQHAHSYAK
jgi:hypothetical protein